MAPGQFRPPRRRAVADEARDDREPEPGGVERVREQAPELAEVRDAGEDVDQHRPHGGPPGDPCEHPHQARRVAAELARPQIAEVQRPQPGRRHLVHHCHGEPGAGGDQPDLAARVQFHVVEALPQLADGIGIGVGARQNEARTVRYLRGLIRSTRWLNDPVNKDAAIRILMEETKAEERYARLTYELYIEDLKVMPREAEVDPRGVDTVLDLMVAGGELPATHPPASRYIDTSFWEKARQALGTTR